MPDILPILLTLSPKLPRIRAQGQEGMKLIREKLAVAYFVLDGHFGHAFATAMGRQRGLPLISKMPHKAELYLLPTTQEKADRPRLKYGVRLDYPQLPAPLRVARTTEGE